MSEQPDRLTSLRSAAALYLSRRSLKTAGVWTVFLGVLWLIVAVLGLRASHTSVLVRIFLFGALVLLAEGIYVLFSLSRLALLLETLTLASLAAVDLISFAIAVSAPHAKGGRPPNPVDALIFGYAAMKMWKLYRNFNRLREQTTDADIEHVADQIKAALAASPDSALNLVPLKRTGLTLKNLQWRLWGDGDYAYLIGAQRVLFKASRPTRVSIYLRSRLSFDTVGESWIGSSRKVRILVDGVPLSAEFELASGMPERLASLTGSILSAG
jgi:hypothetical protein